MTKLAHLSFLIFFSAQIFGQGTKTILLTNNDKRIPFANINVLHTSTRTVSNQLGEFSIELENVSDSDTISISCVGYKTLRMLVSEYKNNTKVDNQIPLEEEVIELAEFVFEGEEMQERILGNPKAGHFLQVGFSRVGPGDQVGTIIRIKENPTFIESFHADISYLDNDSMKLRLNFYSLKKGLPDQKLPFKDIIIETKNLSKGRFDLDLTDYDILITDDFYISLECIENLDAVSHMTFNGSLLNGPVVGKLQEDSEWTKAAAFGIGFSVKVKY